MLSLSRCSFGIRQVLEAQGGGQIAAMRSISKSFTQFKPTTAQRVENGQGAGTENRERQGGNNKNISGNSPNEFGIAAYCFIIIPTLECRSSYQAYPFRLAECFSVSDFS